MSNLSLLLVWYFITN